MTQVISLTAKVEEQVNRIRKKMNKEKRLMEKKNKIYDKDTFKPVPYSKVVERAFKEADLWSYKLEKKSNKEGESIKNGYEHLEE